MSRPLILVVSLLTGLTLSLTAEAEGPFDPFKRLLKYPAEAVRGLARPDTPNPGNAPGARPPAPTKTVTVKDVVVPLPRPRPAIGPVRMDLQYALAAKARRVGAVGRGPATVRPGTEAMASGKAPLALQAAPPTPPTTLVILPQPRPNRAAAVGDQATRSLPKLAALPPSGEVGGSRACVRRLAALGIAAEARAPIRRGSCGIAAPVVVAALGGGTIALTQTATVNCRLGEALARWIDDSVDPLARRKLRGRLIGLRVAASYACRGRNNQRGAKLSEHAYGNAIDISAFRIDGVGWIEVGKPANARQSDFLRSVRQSACGPFATVLGPGADRYHSDHFHFDVIRRGKNGTSTYCR